MPNNGVWHTVHIRQDVSWTQSLTHCLSDDSLLIVCVHLHGVGSIMKSSYGLLGTISSWRKAYGMKMKAFEGLERIFMVWLVAICLPDYFLWFPFLITMVFSQNTATLNIAFRGISVGLWTSNKFWGVCSAKRTSISKLGPLSKIVAWLEMCSSLCNSNASIPWHYLKQLHRSHSWAPSIAHMADSQIWCLCVPFISYQSLGWDFSWVFCHF